ncbi:MULTISPECIES: sigma factor G inhibitor Gin [Clostridium]|uniref:sigma factor G inhibitor Gin n=1 Tax=Clostridium TaxID=1485 RepID=UPI000824BCB7|nr:MULTISPECIES: sigma factor G inhibitor Gin [Clostridium]PJI08061.1 sigma factor G inhibitor Gin [Clostridium sp. CT7]
MKRECIICRKPLKDGIIIKGKGICKNCEKRLINLECGNDFYEYYKNRIKIGIINNLGEKYKNGVSKCIKNP